MARVLGYRPPGPSGAAVTEGVVTVQLHHNPLRCLVSRFLSEISQEGHMDRGTAMLAVVLDVYEGGKDLIPGWELKEQAEHALATGGTEGLRRYYEACLTGSGHRVKTTLEGDRRRTLESERDRFMSIYLGAAR